MDHRVCGSSCQNHTKPTSTPTPTPNPKHAHSPAPQQAISKGGKAVVDWPKDSLLHTAHRQDTCHTQISTETYIHNLKTIVFQKVPIRSSEKSTNAIILEEYQYDNLRKLCYTQISIAKYNYSFDMIIYTKVRIRSSTGKYKYNHLSIERTIRAWIQSPVEK